MTDPNVLEVSVHIKARPETVFGYFTDPVKYAQWMGSEVTIEPTPGGRYRVRMRDGVEVSGQFVEVDEPRRIVFTWGWTHDRAVAPGSTRVEVSLTEDGDGTNVVLRHHGLPDAAQREHHHGGWRVYLDRLGVRATGGDPGPDPNAKPVTSAASAAGLEAGITGSIVAMPRGRLAVPAEWRRGAAGWGVVGRSCVRARRRSW